MPVVGSLSIPIGLDASGLKSGVNDVINSMGALTHVMERGIVGTLIDIEQAGVQAFDSITRTADQLGRMPTDFISSSAVRNITESKRSADEFTLSLQRLNAEAGANISPSVAAVRGIAARRISDATDTIVGLRELMTGGNLTDESAARLRGIVDRPRSMVPGANMVREFMQAPAPRGQRGSPFESVEDELESNIRRRQTFQNQQLEMNRRALQVRIDQ